MAKMINGTNVVAVRDSLKGFYSVGMVGVIDDFRDVDGGEYLVDFEGKDKRVWVNKASLSPVSVFSNGDRVIAIKDSRYYDEGMVGTVQDFRPVDSGEYLVKFDDKKNRVWVSGFNLSSYEKIDYDYDCEPDYIAFAIVLKTKDYEAGTMVKIVNGAFGYYTVTDGNSYSDIEKHELFVLPKDKPFYMHIKDLRKLRELGCEFHSDSGLYFNGKPFIAPDILDVIDKSFVATYEDDYKCISFEYNDKKYYIDSWEINEGLVELRD